ncbi:nuclear receptor coactivator 5-like [Limulus polyphemus]|uniref:Nuclear receptor coactivator 5-like n=1 Tax=Limulus polyphemus TaxID=6850 RepID=A0ABM1SL57_LIMPO|nr:nuclear receptor coactivator 5-like [Limulus polyphemus]XP_022244363.1 nuclear receptor coactivator 5-like [Limulus polyphemus]XP_022244364.1 nuclear receptor coactivator 5-like [Limulus polyphemus]
MTTRSNKGRSSFGRHSPLAGNRYHRQDRDLERHVVRDRSPLRGESRRLLEDRIKEVLWKDDRRGRESFRDDFYTTNRTTEDPYMDVMQRRESGIYSETRLDPKEDVFKRTRASLPDDSLRDSFHDLPLSKSQKPTDCEIIVVHKQQRLYAEHVEARLKNLGMEVGIILLSDESKLAQTVKDLEKQGPVFVIVITPKHELSNTLTINILLGSPEEHHNMPLDDALKLVARNFHEYTLSLRFLNQKTEKKEPQVLTRRSPTPPDRDIGFLLNLLADGKHLTMRELDKIMKYIQDRKDKLAEIELGKLQRTGEIKPEPPIKLHGEQSQPITMEQQQKELQKRILNMINQGSVDAGFSNRGISSSSANQPPSNLKLDNPNLQKAVENFIQTSPDLSKTLMGTSIPTTNTTAVANTYTQQQTLKQSLQNSVTQSNVSANQSALMRNQSTLVSNPTSLVGNQSSLMGNVSSVVGNQSSLITNQPPLMGGLSSGSAVSQIMMGQNPMSFTRGQGMIPGGVGLVPQVVRHPLLGTLVGMTGSFLGRGRGTPGSRY